MTIVAVSVTASVTHPAADNGGSVASAAKTTSTKTASSITSPFTTASVPIPLTGDTGAVSGAVQILSGQTAFFTSLLASAGPESSAAFLDGYTADQASASSQFDQLLTTSGGLYQTDTAGRRLAASSAAGLSLAATQATDGDLLAADIL